MAQKTPRSSSSSIGAKIETVTPRRSSSSSSSSQTPLITTPQHSSSTKKERSSSKELKAEPSSSYKDSRIKKPSKTTKREASRKDDDDLENQKIKASSIKRCARMVGITRLAKDHLEEARKLIDDNLGMVLKRAAIVTVHKRKKTIQHEVLGKAVEDLWGVKLYPLTDRNVNWSSAVEDEDEDFYIKDEDEEDDAELIEEL
nr:unnamed protein product [Naegleria fowleri]